MLDQINLELKPSICLFYLFILVNLSLISLVLLLPLSLLLKTVFGLLVIVFAMLYLALLNRDNYCHLSLFDDQWCVSYGSQKHSIGTPRVRFMTAYWLVLTIKLEGELFSRALYLTPAEIGDKNFRWLCRYFRFMP